MKQDGVQIWVLLIVKIMDVMLNVDGIMVVVAVVVIMNVVEALMRLIMVIVLILIVKIKLLFCESLEGCDWVEDVQWGIVQTIIIH